MELGARPGGPDLLNNHRAEHDRRGGRTESDFCEMGPDWTAISKRLEPMERPSPFSAAAALVGKGRNIFAMGRRYAGLLRRGDRIFNLRQKPTLAFCSDYGHLACAVCVDVAAEEKKIWRGEMPEMWV